jgi:hypothetical protein
MRELILADGARNVGKTFLLSQAPRPTYKLPFAGYFSSLEELPATGGVDMHHFTAGYDLTLFGLYHAGLLAPCVVDRGFLSNIAFDLMQGRITPQRARRYIDYLASHLLLEGVTVLHVTADDRGDDRNKDRWAHLPAGDYVELFREYAAYAKEQAPGLELIEFKNEFDEASVRRFNQLFTP